MQILHTEKGDIQVKRGFQLSVDSPIILETPDGKFIYRDQTLVPRSILEAQGIVPRLTLAPEEIDVEKEYTTAGRARTAMAHRKITEETHFIVGMKRVDGENVISEAGEEPEFFVIRKKGSPEGE
jgi:hypothetical protein